MHFSAMLFPQITKKRVNIFEYFFLVIHTFCGCHSSCIGTLYTTEHFLALITEDWVGILRFLDVFLVGMLVTVVWWYPNGDPNVTTWLGRLSVCTILIIFYYYYYSLLNSTYVILFFNSVQFLSRVGLSFYLNFHHPMNFMFLCVKSKMFNFFFVQLFVFASIKFQNFSFW